MASDRPDNLDSRFDSYLRTRDPAKLAEIFDATAPELLRVATYLVGSAAAAEDLVQETYLALLQRLDSYRPEGRFMGWLLGILTNKALQARSVRKHLELCRDLAGKSTFDPTREAEGRETALYLGKALGLLSEPYQQVVTLHLYGQLSPAAIARALDRNQNTVRSQLQRGLNLLRKALPASLCPAVLPVSLAGLGVIKERVLAYAATLKGSASVATGAGLGMAVGGMALFMKKLLVSAALAVVIAVVSLTIIGSVPQIGNQARSGSVTQSLQEKHKDSTDQEMARPKRVNDKPKIPNRLDRRGLASQIQQVKCVDALGRPVKGVTVSLRRLDSYAPQYREKTQGRSTIEKTKSDLKGNATVKNLMPGKHIVEVSHDYMVNYGADMPRIVIVPQKPPMIRMAPVYCASVKVFGDTATGYMCHFKSTPLVDLDPSNASLNTIARKARKKHPGKILLFGLPSYTSSPSGDNIHTEIPTDGIEVEVRLFLKRLEDQLVGVDFYPLSSTVAESVYDFSGREKHWNHGSLSISLYTPSGLELMGLNFLARSMTSKYFELKSGSPVNVPPGYYYIQCMDIPHISLKKPIRIRNYENVVKRIPAGNNYYRCKFHLDINNLDISSKMDCFIALQKGRYRALGKAHGPLCSQWLSPGDYTLVIGKSFNTKPIASFPFTVETENPARNMPLQFSFPCK